MPRSVVEVSAGILCDRGKILIAKRLPLGHLGGLWEFPGGKREPHETHEECLQRELQEELGVDVCVGELYHRVRHDYPEKSVDLRFFLCRLIQGIPVPLMCDQLAWVQAHELTDYDFPEADAQLIHLLQRDSSQNVWR